MKELFRLALFITVVFLSYFISPITALAEPFKIDSSTQFLWGDDLLGSSQSILAQYLRVSFNPEGEKFSVTGYGRVWQDLTHSKIREDDSSGRLYYLYIDYRPFENASLRLGRQFVNFSAGSSLLDGLSLNARNIGPIGITAAAGRDVRFSLDSEFSRLGNYFLGIDIHLDNVRATKLGISYIMKYDEWDRAREELGMNFRYFYKYISPYAEVRYDFLSRAIDEATVGFDIFPITNLMIKGEFYHTFPTFDSTSIYSVFAVDKYREYLISAEYVLEIPVAVFASYVHQTYEDSESADKYVLGSRFYPIKNLTLNASVDYRIGLGGNLWGFEIFGDYKLSKKFAFAAGIQYDAYDRPDNDNNGSAQRYWLGGQWAISKNVILNARLEENVNQNFGHRPLGRIVLTWNM
jgi:hypothetical protein